MRQKLLGNLEKGLVFVLSAPAGTGKTTLARMLTLEFACVEESVSCTTRASRVGEKDGVDYHFLSHEVFKQKILQGEFLEHAEVFGEFYGTSKQQLERKLSEGKHVLLVIDTQGALQLQKMGFEAVYIFIAPPSIEALSERLAKRQSEDELKRKERLSWAQKEIDLCSFYDFLIVNCDLDVAYTSLKSVLIAEEHRVRKNRSKL